MSASSAAQIQVSLRGAQDILLMSPKEDTLFRVDYRRHTNYASAEAEQQTQTTAALGRRNIQTTISRAGDLLSQMYINASFDAIIPTTAADWNNGQNYVSWTNGLGYAMIDDITMLIGNKQFDNMDGQFMFQREQVAAKSDRKLNQAVGYYETREDRALASMQPQELNVPLQFWYNNFLEQSLPVIGLYWHEMQINLSLKSQADLLYAFNGGYSAGGATANFTTLGLTDLHYICNFQYLDRPERALFANQKLEQIFIQHQDLGDNSWTTTSSAQQQLNIRFNHPVSDLMWAPTGAFTSGTNTDWNTYFNYDGVTYKPFTNGPDLIQEPYKSAQIFFNNQQRTIELSAKYLRQIPQHRAQDRIGDEGVSARVAGYSFSAKTNDILHTGSANFSRYDQATVRMNLWTAADSSGYAAGASTWKTDANIKIHARNWQLNKTSIVRLKSALLCLILTILRTGHDGGQVRRLSDHRGIHRLRKRRVYGVSRIFFLVPPDFGIYIKYISKTGFSIKHGCLYE